MPQGKKKIYDPKFLGGIFRTTLLFVIFIELLSFVNHWLTPSALAGNYLWGILVGVVLLVACSNLKYGLYIAVTELIIGSQGHYFDLTLNNRLVISIRIGVFVAIGLATLVHVLKNKQWKAIYNYLSSNILVVLLGLITLWGLVFAIFRNVSYSNIFFDVNGWLYFLYIIPFILVIKNKKTLNDFWQILTAGIVAISVKSLFFLFVFSHNLPRLTKYLYLWGRDTRWGEFTLIQGNFYRIFSQAQIFVLLGAFIILGYLIFKGRLDYKNKNNKYLSLIVLLCMGTLILSMSRSFWLAFIVTSVLLLIVALFIYKYKFWDILKSFLRILILSICAVGLIIGIVNFPYPELSGKSSSSEAFAERLNLSGAAISSRWSQLPNLTKGIIKHPIIGSGWGAQVTYKSQDPRILTKENPEGWHTTYAFEWGYLDILLKVGLAGLFIYLVFIISIYRDVFNIWKKNKDRFSNALLVGLALGLFSLIIVHGFTPYLNHPLGIGYVLIVLTTLQVLSKNHSKTESKKA